MRNVVCYLLATLVCSACFDLRYMEHKIKLKDRLTKETIVIEETSLHIDGGLVFGVLMLPEEAQRMGAPTGPEFTKLLNERISQHERLIGHKICEHGYERTSKPPFIGEYGIWIVDYHCNPSLQGR